MTLRPAPHPPDPALERRQRQHELAEALAAARRLHSRLEMLGDHPADVHDVRLLRDRLARAAERER